MHTAAALPLYSKEDIYTHRHRRHPQRHRRRLPGRRRALRPHLLDRRLRHPRPPPAARRRPPHRRRPLRRGQDRGRARLRGVPRQGHVRHHHPARSRSSGRSASACSRCFYDWANNGHGFPILGRRQEPLPVPRRRGPLRRDHPGPDRRPRRRQRHLQHRRRALHAPSARTMQAVLDYAGHGKKIRPLPLVTPFVWTLRLLEALKLSPLYKWVYETAYKDSFVSIDRAESVLGFQPQVLEQGVADPQLRVVRREPGGVRAPGGRHAPRALEAGGAALREAAVLGQHFSTSAASSSVSRSADQSRSALSFRRQEESQGSATGLSPASSSDEAPARDSSDVGMTSAALRPGTWPLLQTRRRAGFLLRRNDEGRRNDTPRRPLTRRARRSRCRCASG